MLGRVRIYNLGFVIYTVASLALTIDWMTGTAGALYLIVLRLVQAVGGAFLLANSAAILTDAFPANQRGMALGINNIVGVSGMFIGLVLGGLLAPINWRLVFLISVPVGLFGTVWAYLKLHELSTPRRARIDWPGNITFALGLILIIWLQGIWLQGIWLPEHGADFTQTPLRAGLYMLPLTVGMLIAGPVSGYMSDR